jgi:endo-1,4-beta-xylanase
MQGIPHFSLTVKCKGQNRGFLDPGCPPRDFVGTPIMTKRTHVSALLVAAALAGTRLIAETDMHVAPTSDPTFSELPPSINLWPGAAPGSEGRTSPIEKQWQNYKTTWYATISNINFPAIIPFLPPSDKASGIAVVVCPGGGHRNLAMSHEGFAIGTWCASHGIAAFVLEYRLAQAPNSPYSVEVHSLMDAQRAIRTVRSRAKEWNVDPAKVGVMGFSAGGEVAALAATRFRDPVQGSHDAVDQFDCRPDFQALFYPMLPAVLPTPRAGTPPAFFCGAHQDEDHLGPMVEYYTKLAGHGISTEMHIYATGGHGFGIRALDQPEYSWTGLFETWVHVVTKAP